MVAHTYNPVGRFKVIHTHSQGFTYLTKLQILSIQPLCFDFYIVVLHFIDIKHTKTNYKDTRFNYTVRNVLPSKLLDLIKIR